MAGRGWRRAREVDIGTHTLALAAQQVFCTAPLVVALAAVVQRFAGQDVTTLLARYLGLRGPAVREVTSMFTPTAPVNTSGLVIGLAVVVVFSTGVAATQQRSYELSWGLARATGLRETARRAWWLLALLAYVVVVLYSGQLVHRVVATRLLDVAVRVVVQLLVSVLFFWWSQHTLLGGRVPWRALRPGAVAIATGTTVLVLVSSWVLPDQITSEVEEYGPIGAPFVLSLWLLVYSGIITGGALLGAVVVQHSSIHHGATRHLRGDSAQPADDLGEDDADETLAARPQLTSTRVWARGGEEVPGAERERPCEVGDTPDDPVLRVGVAKGQHDLGREQSSATNGSPGPTRGPRHHPLTDQ